MTRAIELVLGFDFGLKRIGVAVGQTLTKSANPLTTVPAEQGQPDWRTLDKLIQTWRPQALIVGRPLRLDGSEQAITAASDVFASALQTQYHLPIFRVDEALTSRAAKDFLIERMQTKKQVKPQLDPISAKIIVEVWLNQL